MRLADDTKDPIIYPLFPFPQQTSKTSVFRLCAEYHVRKVSQVVSRLPLRYFIEPKRLTNAYWHSMFLL